MCSLREGRGEKINLARGVHSPRAYTYSVGSLHLCGTQRKGALVDFLVGICAAPSVCRLCRPPSRPPSPSVVYTRIVQIRVSCTASRALVRRADPNATGRPLNRRKPNADGNQEWKPNANQECELCDDKGGHGDAPAAASGGFNAAVMHAWTALTCSTAIP